MVMAESKMSVSIGKTLAILSFFVILTPRAGLTATHGRGAIKGLSPGHLNFHRSFNPEGQVESDRLGTAFLAAEKDVELPGSCKDLSPIRERASLANTASCVVPAARFILVRSVSKYIFLSSLNL